MAKRLTEQQEQFCQHYVNLRHATNAAKAAGYSEKSAYEMGSRLLKRVEINSRIFEIRSGMMADVKISAQRVLQELAAIAFSSLHDVADYNRADMDIKDFSELSRQELAAVQSVRVTQVKDGTNVHIQLYDKQKALEMLGRYLALFNDSVKLESDKPLQIQIVEVAGDNDSGG